MNAEDAAKLMLSFSLFEGYTARGTLSLIERGQIYEWPGDHQLYVQGTPATSVVLILTGEVEHSIAHAGREVRLGTAGPSQVLADVQVLGGMSHPASARTTGDTMVVAWEAPAFKRLVAADRLFSQRVFHQTAVALALQAETLTASLAAVTE